MQLFEVDAAGVPFWTLHHGLKLSACVLSPGAWQVALLFHWDADVCVLLTRSYDVCAVLYTAPSKGGYESGVYNGCSINKTTIDHAVQLVGYGTEAGQDYWLVRNSWSAKWGDGGYIKLPRDATPACGEDTSPGSGNGCKQGTGNEQKVCGACGMLSDSRWVLHSCLCPRHL